MINLSFNIVVAFQLTAENGSDLHIFFSKFVTCILNIFAWKEAYYKAVCGIKINVIISIHQYHYNV